MSHSNSAEDWGNGPRVTVVTPGQFLVRDHYCIERRAVVGLRVSGMGQSADVFCPLCGVLATADFTNHRYDGAIRLGDHAGSKCEHGMLDRRCVDLVREIKGESYDLELSGAIREYRAVQIAMRYNCAPTVLDWVRLCPACRSEFAESMYPAILHELRVLAERLASQLREENGKLLSLAEDARELCEITRTLESVCADLQKPNPSLRQGFVYLIAGGDAVKIGFSEKHPSIGRLSQLQTASAHELQIAGLLVGTEADERGLHVRFAKHRIRGEWFRRCEEIEAYFSERTLPL